MTQIKLVDVNALQNMPRTPLTVADVPAEHIEWYNRSQMDFNKDLGLRGKYCYHPFNTVTIDSKGECYVCTCQAWLPISVGNILDFESLTDIVQSPKAREIQASIIDGTYRYCDDKTCHLLIRNGLEGRITHRPDTVNWIVFAIDESCNLTCPSCRTEMMFHNKGPEFEHRMAISNHITKLIQNHHHFLKFTLSGDGDPFASHVYRNILENLKLTESDPVEIEIVTNGILAKSHWDRMEGIHKHVTRFKISFDAGSADTYHITRRGGDWDKLIESCEYIIKWKQKNYSNMEIVANFVVQNLNYRDIHNYVKLTLDMGFDEVSFQKVTDWGKWTVGGVNYFTEHAVWMEDHPNHQELVSILSDNLLNNRKIQLTNLSHLRKKNTPNKLSDLVKLRSQLESLHVADVIGELDTLRSTIGFIAPTVKSYQEDFEEPLNLLRSIENKTVEFKNKIEPILQKIDYEIKGITANYMKRGYKINGFFATNRTDSIGERTRVMPLNDSARELVKSQISKYVSWKYPGLEIGPGDGEWTTHMVACDPLYLVDIHQEFLDVTKGLFNPEYQRKLCMYITSETDLSMLPQNQIGFAFSWNVFNYLPYDLIDQYLAHIYSVLRPGGVSMFSYNNAERYHCAVNVEKGFMSYMPKRLLLELISKHGFELIVAQDIDDYVSWVEIRKPGELTSIKEHPSLGVVKDR